MTSAAGYGPADEHLGENLAALVDGELCHERRDRVLAHLATCPTCRAEADAQRRLKSVFAESPLPGPSDTLLARLQNLPAGGALADGAETGAAVTDGALRPGSASAGLSLDSLDLLPGGGERESLLRPPSLGPRQGFRIHEPGDARAARGHRLAFAAAGAVSLAAFAIGGAVSTVGSGTDTVGPATTPNTVEAGSAHPRGGPTKARSVSQPLMVAAGLISVAGPATPIGHGGQAGPVGHGGQRGQVVPLLRPALAPVAPPAALVTAFAEFGPAAPDVAEKVRPR